jgi:hypothetical protein
MPRPKKQLKKEAKVILHCTNEEKEMIILNAKKVGLPVSVYLRNLALNYPINKW